MRLPAFAAAALLAACASSAPVTTATLVSADASTTLLVGQQITQETSTAAAGEGQDPLVRLTLRHADGRALAFQQANHTPHDLMAQAGGGALAQIMGLFGEEAPLLYHATPDANEGAAFLCAPDGPVSIGVHTGADGAVRIVGLKQAIQFETRPDGVEEALPYSPDQVCARLRFTQ